MGKTIIFSGNCPKCNTKVPYSSKNISNNCVNCKIKLGIDYGLFKRADEEYTYGYFLKEIE